MRKISVKVGEACKKILFLGYDERETSIISRLVELGHEVWHTSDSVDELDDFDLIVSFGFRYIIKESLLSKLSQPIINLHIAYLPYNRGAHPNFWAFFDGTPSGVTIHLVDKGIDTGDILFQRAVKFSENEDTFILSYKRLIDEIEMLFIDNVESIVNMTFKSIPQVGQGTFHKLKDFPVEFRGWDCKVKDEIKRLHLIMDHD